MRAKEIPGFHLVSWRGFMSKGELAILIVEDNPVMRTLYKDIIEETMTDYINVTKIIEAESLEEGIEQQKRHPDISLLLLDLNLSLATFGISTYREAKEIFPELTIIVITGEDSPDTRTLSRSVGDKRFFNKNDLLKEPKKFINDLYGAIAEHQLAGFTKSLRNSNSLLANFLKTEE